MLVGIWAILSCGAQYIPLDGGVVPDSTIQHVVDQSEGEIVLCLSSTEYRIHNLFPGLTPVLIDQCMTAHTDFPAGNWIDLASPHTGCYVIYTSGSSPPSALLNTCWRPILY